MGANPNEIYQAFMKPIDDAFERKRLQEENRRKILMALAENKALPDSFRFAPYEGAEKEGVMIGNIPLTESQKADAEYKKVLMQKSLADLNKEPEVDFNFPAGYRGISKENYDKYGAGRAEQFYDPKSGKTFYGIPTELTKQKEQLEMQKLQQKETESTKNIGGKTLPSGSAERLGDQYASISQLDMMMKDAFNIPGLTYSLADKALVNIPGHVGGNSFKQLVKSTKQIIGKGLEGGVLRKEDEVKYEDIIPNIGDTKPVLQNKANQLRMMLNNKLNETQESLVSAGYDLSKYKPVMNIKYSYEKEKQNKPEKTSINMFESNNGNIYKLPY